MKRTHLLVIVFLLPLMLSAGLADQLKHLRLGMPAMEINRGWRLNERTDEYYQDGWGPSGKYVYYYQSSVSSKIDSVQVLSWDEDSGSYQISMSWHYEYNGNGQVIATTGFYVIPGMGHIPIFYTSSVYDGSQRLLHYYMNIMNMGTGQVEPMARTHFIYTGNRLTTVYSWESMMDKINDYNKSTFSYNGQGQVTSLLSQVSSDSANWVNSENETITYHPNDTSNENTVITYFANFLTMAFFVADPWMMLFGMPSLDLIDAWDGAAWVPSDRVTFTWNNQNKLVSRLEEVNVNNSWQDQFKYTLSYDTNNNVYQVVEEYSDTGVLQPENRYTYNWESYTSVEDGLLPIVNSLQVRSYPQPFSGELNIAAASKNADAIKLEIFNLKGQLIHKSLVLPGSIYKWNGLDVHGISCASGIYYLKASQGNRTFSSRIVKLK